MNDWERLQYCLQCVRKRTDFQPRIALVLGSGLGGYADTMQIEAIVPYREIDGFPLATVPGHIGRFVFGYVGNVPVVAMQGRVHYYEGYDMKEVVLPIRLMRMLGAETLFLTNAAGGINPSFQVGDFMMITDQIANFVPSPLIGKNMEQLGTRFPDMSHVYDLELQDVLRNAAAKVGVRLQEGVYIQLTGPNFETPAEIRMCGVLGADVVGMSTACEAIAANHMRMRVCGISCVSNLAAGISKTPLTHEEVKETSDRVAPLFQKLLTEAITNM